VQSSAQGQLSTAGNHVIHRVRRASSQQQKRANAALNQSHS